MALSVDYRRRSMVLKDSPEVAASIVPKAIATMLLFVLTPELVFLARRRSALSTISRHEAKQASVVAKLAAASHEHEAERRGGGN